MQVGCLLLILSHHAMASLLKRRLYDYKPEVPSTANTPVDVPRPFRVIWNSPDFHCWNNNIDFNLESFGIESNGKRWMGDTISIYYSVGKWPRVDLLNQSQWLDGGLPQYGNLTAHLNSIRKGIPAGSPPTASGFGVIDMEKWRPLLETSYGWLKPYKKIQIDEIARLYPIMTPTDRLNLAKEIWYSATRVLMESALKLSKSLRPQRRWGYYGYPELSSHGAPNDRLAWLWKITTAFYPSIYIYHFNHSSHFVEKRQVKVLSEAFRVRALYGEQEAPIMAYTRVHSPSLGFFEEKWLDLAVRMPLDMGVDGIIIWGSSIHYHGNSTDKCLQVKTYVDNTLGPKIKSLIDNMTRCSLELCAAKGRCIHRKYAGNVWYLNNRGGRAVSLGQTPQVSAEDEELSGGFQLEYVCQCYRGWAGVRCNDGLGDYNYNESQLKTTDIPGFDDQMPSPFSDIRMHMKMKGNK